MGRTSGTLVATSVALLLVLAGCSGNDDDAAAPPSAPAVATTGPTTTVRPVDTSFGGQDSAEFCAQARTYNERFSTLGSNPTPEQLRMAAGEGQTALSQSAGVAPAEIKPDVEVVVAAFAVLVAELEKVDFDSRRSSLNALSVLQTPEFQASSTRLQAYLRTVCGVSG